MPERGRLEQADQRSRQRAGLARRHQDSATPADQNLRHAAIGARHDSARGGEGFAADEAEALPVAWSGHHVGFREDAREFLRGHGAGEFDKVTKANQSPFEEGAHADAGNGRRHFASDKAETNPGRAPVNFGYRIGQIDHTLAQLDPADERDSVGGSPGGDGEQFW